MKQSISELGTADCYQQGRIAAEAGADRHSGPADILVRCAFDEEIRRGRVRDWNRGFDDQRHETQPR